MHAPIYRLQKGLYELIMSCINSLELNMVVKFNFTFHFFSLKKEVIYHTLDVDELSGGISVEDGIYVMTLYVLHK